MRLLGCTFELKWAHWCVQMKKTFVVPNGMVDPVLLVDPVDPNRTRVISAAEAKELVKNRHARWAGGTTVPTECGKRGMRIVRLRQAMNFALRGCSAIMSPRHPKHGPDSGFYRGYLAALCSGNDKRRNAVEAALAGWR